MKDIHPRVTFDWAFVQTSNAKLEEAECREKLVGMIGRSEFTLAMARRVLVLVSHRVEASRPAGYIGIEGLLQLLGSAMTLAKQNLPAKGFDAVKEFMISRLSHLKVLCTTPIPSGVLDCESACGRLVRHCQYFFQLLIVLSHPFSAVTLATGPCLVIS